MGILAAAGFEILIGASISLVFFLIGLFFGYINIFDSLALAVIGGFAAHGILHINPWLSALLGVAIFGLLLWIQSTTPGFWIIGGLLSIAWGFIFSLFAFSISGENPVWTIGVWIAGTLVMLFLHKIAWNKTYG